MSVYCTSKFAVRGLTQAAGSVAWSVFVQTLDLTTCSDRVWTVWNYRECICPGLYQDFNALVDRYSALFSSIAKLLTPAGTVDTLQADMVKHMGDEGGVIDPVILKCRLNHVLDPCLPAHKDNGHCAD